MNHDVERSFLRVVKQNKVFIQPVMRIYFVQNLKMTEPRQLPNAKNIGLKAPFPYFGGKSTVADVVWARFGNVKNYVEPFVGSAAVLLRRPWEHLEEQNCIETVNDIDGMVCNFWRAVTLYPELTAANADWPVIENDLHARHRLLVSKKESLKEKLEADPEYCDVRVAGWWVWGMSIWIGGGFCRELSHQKPNLGTIGGTARHGVKREVPSFGFGKGINRTHRKIPELGVKQGVFRRGPRLARGCGIQQEGRHVHLGRSYELQSGAYDVYEDFAMLSQRLRHVRVICGDWKRAISPTATHYHSGITGVFLDPPYLHSQRDKGLYAHDEDVFEETWEYAMENGNNPKLRIALCGYDDGRKAKKGWEMYRWKANGGYARLGKGRGQENRSREVIWFSPHCLKQEQGKLFGEG